MIIDEQIKIEETNSAQEYPTGPSENDLEDFTEVSPEPVLE